MDVNEVEGTKKASPTDASAQEKQEEKPKKEQVQVKALNLKSVVEDLKDVNNWV